MGFESEFDDSGFDEFEKKFEEISKKAENKVTLYQLLTNSFIKKHTGYKDLDSFADVSDIDFSEPEEAIESEEWDSYVKENSSFSGWDEMKKAAAKQYMIDKLKFD